MKTFEIEFRRESYVVLTVEADTEEQAEEMAWKQLEQDGYGDDGACTLEINSIEEQEQA